MRIIFLALLLAPYLSFTQPVKDPTAEEVKTAYASIPKLDGQYEFSAVVQLDTSFTKDALYKNAKLFFTNTFKSAKEVLQYDDRAEGKTIGKGNFQIEDGQTMFLSFFTMRYVVNFTLEIFCKDGRYKYRMYGFNIDYHAETSGTSTANNYNNGNYGLDEAYQRTQKGVSKKMDRRLFISTLAHIQATIETLKTAMQHPSSKDDF